MTATLPAIGHAADLTVMTKTVEFVIPVYNEEVDLAASVRRLDDALAVSFPYEYRITNRGGKGIKCYKITEKTGDVVGVKAVNDDHEIMMITSAGIIIQIRMNEVPVHGRITSGVKLINLEDGVKVVKIAKVREDVDDDTMQTEDRTENEKEDN